MSWPAIHPRALFGRQHSTNVPRARAPGVELPETKRRAAKPEYSDEDVEAWTPGATGQRHASDKKIRKTVRQAKERAEKSQKENL